MKHIKKEDISKYFDNMQNDDQNNEIKLHLSVCEECNTIFKEYQQISDMTIIEDIDVPYNLYNGILDKMENMKKISFATRFSFALVLLLFFIFSFGFSLYQGKSAFNLKQTASDGSSQDVLVSNLTSFPDGTLGNSLISFQKDVK